MNKWKKILRRILVFILISGMMASTFGVSVAAITSTKSKPVVNNENEQIEQPEKPKPEEYKDPTEDYTDIGNEVTLKDDVEVLTSDESKEVNDSIVSIESKESYSGAYLEITLNGEEHVALEDVSYDDIIYLQGDKDTPFGEDRILRVDSISSYGGSTHIRAEEPYFEEVFESLEVCSSDLLSESNFQGAYYAEGVTSHFGDVDKEMSDSVQSSSANQEEYQVASLSTNQQYTITKTATKHSTEGDDLIVEIDYDFGKNTKKEESDSAVQTSFGIKGSFGIKDLMAYIVCDMPKAAQFEELYLGLSGQQYADINFYGNVSADSSMEASGKDTAFFKLEGINDKRFPIAVFKFQGTTPVYITNKAFENQRESIIPSLYLILYADWEGKISLDLQGGIGYSRSFNSGLRVYKNGEPCLAFENYPYVEAGESKDEDGVYWEWQLKLEADTDLTLFGGSVLFYIGGINVGEISAARVGVQAKCSATMKGGSKGWDVIPNKENTECYIRGYLKILEAKVKLKAEGKKFLSKLSIDINFEFALLDLDLFLYGNKPDKYKNKMPISSMEVPQEFTTAMTLVIDVSGSMDSTIASGERKLDAAKGAAKVIVDSTESWSNSYDGNYGMGVVKFSDTAEMVAVPHIDYKFIRECIDYIEDGGGTSIGSGIESGVNQLQAVESENKIMILMTDGEDNNDSATHAAAKKAAEAKIKIYTIGFGDSVNEEILKEVAEITGGEYRFANTDSVIGIIGSFMYAQQASNATVLTEVEGAVGEGETSDKSSFTVDNLNGDLMVSTVWPGSFLDTILTDPNGREVDENYPGAVTDESKIPSTITVKNPIQGKWEMKVKGIETSYDEEPFYTIVSFKETEEHAVNDKMTKLQMVAAYCMPIGFFATLTSIMLLCCVRVGKKNDEK